MDRKDPMLGRKGRLFLLFTALALSVFALGLACGDDDDDDAGDAAPGDDDNADGLQSPADEECHSGHFLSYDLTEGKRNIPYPSLVFTKPSDDTATGFSLDINGQLTTFLDPVLEKTRSYLLDMLLLDGFGVTAPVWFHADTPPNPAVLRQIAEPDITDPVFCAVLEDADHPHFGELWQVDVNYLADIQVIQAVPHLPFAENTTYMCVARNTLCTELCDCYETPDHLAYVMRQLADEQHPQREQLEPYRANLAPFFEQFFATYDIQPWQIASATVFRTQWVSRDLILIRDQLEQHAAQQLPAVGKWKRIEGASAHPDVDSVWEAKYETVEWRHDGTFQRGPDGIPIPNGTQTVTLRLTLPDPERFEQPYPVVLFGHGLLGDREQSTPIYETLAANGIATAAIDWAFHGDRGPILGLLPELFGIVGRFLAFTPVLAPERMRDNFRQGVTDMIWLKHVIRGLDQLDLAPAATDGDGLPDLDPECIMFAGISMGSAHGTILAAVEPDIDTYLLMSAAANWRASVLDGNMDGFMVLIVDMLLDGFEGMFEFENESDVALFYQLQVNISEAGDPYSYAPTVLHEPLVKRESRINLLHMMPASDNITGALGEAELARSLGTTLLRPFVWRIQEIDVDDTPFYGPATFQYDTDNHVFMREPEAEFFEEGHKQMAKFLRTAADNGVGKVINPFKK
jgi:hypothetical protein